MLSYSGHAPPHLLEHPSIGPGYPDGRPQRSGGRGEGRHDGTWSPPLSLRRGIVTLSFDTERAWGSVDGTSVSEFERRYRDVPRVSDRLLDSVRDHGLSATWAIVGALFLSRSPRNGAPIAEGVTWPPDRRAARAPDGDEATRPLWYARDFVSKIASCEVPQEIASHGLTHELASRLTRERFRTELRVCRALARTLGRSLDTYIFPRNIERHHDVLAEEGFICYRGGARVWPRYATPALRAYRFVDALRGAPPRNRTPSLHPSGLVNVPETFFFGPRNGIRRWIPLRSRLQRVARAIEAAGENGELFHLWLHPFNLCTNPDDLMDALTLIFEEIDRQRRLGKIDVLTMADVARRWRAGEL